MNEFLVYILKSTLCISILYLVFRTLMRKETFFYINRLLLVTIVLFSLTIPLLQLPQIIRFKAPESLIPVLDEMENPVVIQPESETLDITNGITQLPVSEKSTFPTLIQSLQYAYLAGMAISVIVLIYSVLSVLMIFRRAQVKRMSGFRLVIIEKEIPAFSFSHFIFISQQDYEDHRQALLAHEQAHIQLKHFFDLMLLEMVKTLHWFNPVMYWLIRDLKEIHEFQADDHALSNGIDSTQYQLLIIKKCVGTQRFSLANSFNYCQIKKRIAMINKQKTGKSGRWKVAAFLPLLALLLMAFGKKGEVLIQNSSQPDSAIAPSELVQKQYEQFKRKIEIKMDGNYIDSKQCSLQEITKVGKDWFKTSNDWILLLVDESIPLNRIDEVREALGNDYWVVQSTVNSNDLIYFSGDVSESAKFTQGKWGEWMANQLINSPEIKSKIGQYKLAYSFIVDRNGKVRDAHLTKRCDFSEVNAVYEKILTQIPDWEPAGRGGLKVSAYFKFSGYARYVPPVIKK